MTVADLGIKITTDAEKAARELNALTGASQKAETAAQSLASKTTQAATASKSMAASAQLEAKALNSSAAAARTAANANQQFTRSLETTKFATANVAAQLNDIGVQLASGTSPFLIAIQQGTQLNQVFGQTGFRGVISLLGGAFTSLINPVSLATIGIIGLGGAAVQYFYDMVSGSEKSAEALEKEAKLIQSVADKWGDATPALKAYADERQRLADMGDLKTVMGTAAAEQFAAVTAEVDNLKISIGDVVSSLRLAGAETSQITEMQDAFTKLQKAVADSTATSEDAKAVQSSLIGLYVNTGLPAVGDLAKQFYALRDAIAAASGEANKFKVAQEDGLLTNWKGVTSQLSPLGTVGPVFSGGGNFIDADQVQTDRANATKSQFEKDRERTERAAGRSAESLEKSYDRLITSGKNYISMQDATRKAFGMTDLEAAKFTHTQELLNQAQSAGLKLTPGQVAELSRLGAAMGEAEVAAVKVKEHMRDLARQSEATQRAWERFGDGATDVFTGLVTNTMSWKEALRSAIPLIEDLIKNLIKANSIGAGGGGGGGLGSWLASLFGGGTTSYASDILSGVRVGLFHDGRYPGNPGSSRMANPSWFVGAPRYHNGRIPGLKADEEPAILRRNEPVFRSMQHARDVVGANSNQQPAANQNGMDVNVTVSIDENGNLQAFVQKTSRAEIKKSGVGSVAQHARNHAEAKRRSMIK